MNFHCLRVETSRCLRIKEFSKCKELIYDFPNPQFLRGGNRGPQRHGTSARAHVSEKSPGHLGPVSHPLFDAVCLQPRLPYIRLIFSLHQCLCSKSWWEVCFQVSCWVLILDLQKYSLIFSTKYNFQRWSIVCHYIILLSFPFSLF